MNTSKLIEMVGGDAEPQENLNDPEAIRNKRTDELAQIIDALRKVEHSPEWSTLKEHLFDKVLEVLEKARIREAAQANPDLNKLHRLNGQIAWAKRYADLGSLAKLLQSELTNLQVTKHG